MSPKPLEMMVSHPSMSQTACNMEKPHKESFKRYASHEVT